MRLVKKCGLNSDFTHTFCFCELLRVQIRVRLGGRSKVDYSECVGYIYITKASKTDQSDRSVGVDSPPQYFIPSTGHAGMVRRYRYL